jgi:hypothetical protein
MHEDLDGHLPSELKAAPDEFVQWAQAQLQAEEIANTPTVPLYHYTRQAGFEGILTNQTFRCFSYRHQSDPTEFAYSLEIARKLIKETGAVADWFKKHLCGCLDDLLESNDVADSFEFYLFSLSKHRDHARQWQEFGDGGAGIAIGFSPILFQPTETELHDLANENVHVGTIIYGDSLTARRHRVAIECAAEITSRIGQAHLASVKAVGPVAYLRAMADELLARQLIWNCLTSKHSKYQSEQEVRCIIMNLPSKFDGLRAFCGERPYVDTPMPLRAEGISEILVGPNAPHGKEGEVRQCLAAWGYPDTIPVSRSSVTVGC